ncbi:hypothetical protein MRX96_058125 [Rhipicephalus microplus]
MVTIKATDAEFHRQHYNQLRTRRTDSAECTTFEAELKQEAHETSKERPKSPGAPDANSRPDMDDNQVGNDISSDNQIAIKSPILVKMCYVDPSQADVTRITTKLKGKEG